MDNNNSNTDKTTNTHKVWKLDEELPAKLINVVIISGFVNSSPVASTIVLKNGINLSKREFQLKFCSKNNNQLASNILVNILGNKPCEELDNLLKDFTYKPITVVGSLALLFGSSLSSEINNNKFIINASKINLESVAIDGEMIDEDTIKSDTSSDNNPWGI